MFKTIRKMLKDRKGELKSIVNIVVGLFLAAILLPIAITQVYEATTTNWNTAVATTFQVLLPVVGVLAIAMIFISKLVSKGK